MRADSSAVRRGVTASSHLRIVSALGRSSGNSGKTLAPNAVCHRQRDDGWAKSPRIDSRASCEKGRTDNQSRYHMSRHGRAHPVVAVPMRLHRGNLGYKMY